MPTHPAESGSSAGCISVNPAVWFSALGHEPFRATHLRWIGGHADTNVKDKLPDEKDNRQRVDGFISDTIGALSIYAN